MPLSHPNRLSIGRALYQNSKQLHREKEFTRNLKKETHFGDKNKDKVTYLTKIGLLLVSARVHKFSAQLDVLTEAFPKTKNAGRFDVLYYPNKKEQNQVQC